ncbi:MAG: hypothetical protein AB7G23_10815 [Vicinamibacterales bacterium]
MDRDATNADEANAAWLCTKHHARYDAKSRQTKGHTVDELLTYRGMLYEHMATSLTWSDSGGQTTRGPVISLELFDRRIPAYRATQAFLREAVNGRRLELDKIFEFARQTDEALFLFDDHLAGYLRELYRRAVQLHALYAMREAPDSDRAQLSREWADAMLWFTEQFEESRRRFAPYMRVGGRLANQRLQPTAAQVVTKPTKESRRG